MSMLFNGALVVDDYHSKDGFFEASAGLPRSSSPTTCKLRVSKDDTTLTYDIPNDGTWRTWHKYPLQLGDGEYRIGLYRNVSGKKYALAGQMTLPVSMEDPNAPYLHPNCFVDYEDIDLIEAIADSCEGHTDIETLEGIRYYMKHSFVYDYVRAILAKNAMPDINRCMSKHMGICQDLAATMAALLRLDGIPAKLVIGYRGRQYHAWVEAYVDGLWELIDITAEIMGRRKKEEYAVERWY